MYTKDGGESWNKVIEYKQATHHVSLINASNEIVDELYIAVENANTNDRVVYRITD